MRNLLFVFGYKIEMRPNQVCEINVSLDTGVPAHSTGRIGKFKKCLPLLFIAKKFHSL